MNIKDWEGKDTLGNRVSKVSALQNFWLLWGWCHIYQETQEWDLNKPAKLLFSNMGKLLPPIILKAGAFFNTLYYTK